MATVLFGIVMLAGLGTYAACGAGAAMKPLQIAAYGCAILVSLLFLYPYIWMVLGAFRSTGEILSAPLRLWPEHPNLDAFRGLDDVGGVTFIRALANSVGITAASSLLAVVVTALGAYALTRRRNLSGLRLLRGGFLLTMMYPYMLLVIPVYIVVYKLGLLGGYTGIVLFLSLGPVQFFLFEQFFRTLPGEVIEAATTRRRQRSRHPVPHRAADGAPRGSRRSPLSPSC